MSKQRKNPKRSQRRPDAPQKPRASERLYERACRLAEQGQHARARRLFEELRQRVTEACQLALIRNDLAALAARQGDRDAALRGFRAALDLDAACEPARVNLDRLGAPCPAVRAAPLGHQQGPVAAPPAAPAGPIKVAVLSFLFNWPSTGGGIVHTVELAQFLGRAGYDVRHLYARYAPWGIGEVGQVLPHASEALAFDDASWNLAAIQARFRRAVDAFAPDYVLVTDSWNMKPLLAEAVRGYPTILRLQAMECLCPLNNVRLLPEPGGRCRQCHLDQLSSPQGCAACLRQRGACSGGLHQAERAISGVGTPVYHARLLGALREAEAVLVVNPLTESLVRPYARDVRVVTAGMDPARFPWPWPDEPARVPEAPRTVFFAGLVDEWMKGFHVLREACRLLWQRRQDFELVATGEPAGAGEPGTCFVGWLTQAELPRYLRAADMVVLPTVAQEALGRTAVEAMAVGRPVVASRLGGLPATVVDGVTGLLCEPGDPEDLARKIETLLDDAALRERLGLAGRQRFEEHYAWPVIIERHYKPLLARRRTEVGARPAAALTPAAATSLAEAPAVTAAVGCVLAIRNRPAEVLERTLQTYAYQTLQPADKVLLDYGSDAEDLAAYAELCRLYGWRLARAVPPPDRWQLSAAYNLAVSVLRPGLDVVFKCDVDVLLGDNGLETAARLGRDAFCQFQYLTVPQQVSVPDRFTSPAQLQNLFARCQKTTPSVGQGFFACPLRWFTEVGGFDLEYRSWGYEDHDLRGRAERALPVLEVPWREALLLHQWHSPSVEGAAADENRDYFLRMRRAGQVVRNGGRSVPPGLSAEAVAEPATASGSAPPPPAAAPRRAKVIFATRSLHEALYRLSDEFIPAAGSGPPDLEFTGRVRLTDTDALDYFRQLARLDADWVVNLDEDAFLLDADALAGLIRRMATEGYAASGMPDGGVVPIRCHNPVVCNAYFTVLDLHRVRSVWQDWDRVRAARHSPAFERVVPDFAMRAAYAFDHYEPYYGAYFALLAAGERLLYLDGEEWRDGTSTLLKAPDGRPLLLHCWYGRDWERDAKTRERVAAALGYAHMIRSPAPSVVTARSWREQAVKTLIAVHVYDRIENVTRWLRAWHRADTAGARILIMHNQDSPDARATQAILRGRPDVYLPRANRGFDIGAFQEVVLGHYEDLLPAWEHLLWCTDDFLPLRPDFLQRFLERTVDPAVGLVAGRYGYWPGHFSGLERERHCRTVGFLIRRDVARRLRFPAERVVSRDQCLAFEHRPGHLMEQVLALGYQVADLGDADATVMWDANHEQGLQRWPAFEAAFPPEAA
jgi:glycosyltransferase involved in cell wall biosynthesis